MMPSPTLPKTLGRFIAHFLKPYKPWVTLYVILGFAAGFWGPFNSILLKKLIDALPHATHGDVSILFMPASLIALNFLIFDNVTWRGVAYIKCKCLPFILNAMDSALLHHTLGHSHPFFADRMAGTLAKNIFHLVEGAERIVSSIATNMLRGASLLLMAFIFAYQVHPVFFIILCLWSILFFGTSLVMSKRLVALSEDQSSKESILGGEIVDSLTHASSVALFAHRDHEITRRQGSLAQYRKAYQKKELYALTMHGIQGTLIAVMIAFSCYFLISLYRDGLVTLGDFALILGLAIEAGHMMWFTMDQVDELNKAVGRCKQSLSTLMIPFEITDAPNADTLGNVKGQITFQDVTFHYKGATPLFKNKSITIEAGQKVGLVGYSGGGKSTFVNLILRLYDVTGGSIMIDGHTIQNVTQDSLRRMIAMIPQDPSLFHRSLKDNIRYGRMEATDDEVIAAARKAHAHEFIEKLPQGYDALVGERGVKLSGGQRQRIAIARAILKNAPILILDEATSQLDSISEHFIQESLWDLMQGKTTLVIAHRLSTLLHMDRILVFDKGVIVADGTHTQLLAQGGLYKHLWEAQVGGFLMDDTTKN